MRGIGQDLPEPRINLGGERNLLALKHSEQRLQRSIH